MRLQRFAGVHNWTIIGDVEVLRDHASRFYADDARVLLARAEGAFTALICADGQRRYVMTSDWEAAQRLPGSERAGSV